MNTENLVVTVLKRRKDRALAVGTLTTSLVLGLACAAGDRAEQIEFGASSAPIYRTGPVDLRVRAVNARGREVANVEFQYTATPSEVVTIDAQGRVTCHRVGEATVTASGGGAIGHTAVRCRPVLELKAPKSLQLVEGGEPRGLDLSVKFIGGDSEEFHFDAKSADEAVVQLDNQRVVGKMLGRTTLTTTVGDHQAVTNVEVVRKIEQGPLMLNDGASTNWTLGRGKYLVRADVSTPSNPYGVTVRWVGGADCKAVPESQRPESTCRVPDTGSVIIENPTTFGLGPLARGNVSIYQVPE